MFYYTNTGKHVLNKHDNNVVMTLTSQLCLVAISWLSAGPMHMVEHSTS